MIRSTLATAAAALLLAAPAAAAQIFSTGYDTPNGDGQASGGTYNYWDVNYSGSGATSTDGAPLSGGSGDLTDGVVASDVWYLVENNAGTGPYVGWYKTATPNPVVTFHFTGSPTINAVAINLDNSYVGGVYFPNILIDGVLHAYVPPAIGTNGTVTIGGLNLTGNTHTIEFDQNFGAWAFISEVSFFGGAVPEPATWGMLLAGFSLVGIAARRRKASVAA